MKAGIVELEDEIDDKYPYRFEDQRHQIRKALIFAFCFQRNSVSLEFSTLWNFRHVKWSDCSDLTFLSNTEIVS
jgi:hypothetical protein